MLRTPPTKHWMPTTKRTWPNSIQLADSIENHNLFDELDLAARREQCDWEPPFREKGGGTLLPHLVHFRNLGRILKVRALREIEQGKIDDALKTTRLGYVLAKDVAKEPMLISGLVSINITSAMNDCLREIMIRPDTPNLYWALSEFPSRARNPPRMLGRRKRMVGRQQSPARKIKSWRRNNRR